MSSFYSLFSSSKGNASFIGSASGGILVDAGVSCRRLTHALLAHDIPIESVQAILITHAHSDHVSGLRVLLKKYPIPVYGTADTLEQLEGMNCLPENIPQFSLNAGEQIHIGETSVTAFDTMHDSAGSCGYRLVLPDGQCCAVCTDLGCVTQEVLTGVSGADLVLLEANYDPEMLRCGMYPPMLQKRIRGEYGHLSNLDSGNLAVQLVEGGTTRLVLGHLSQQNNTMPLAEQTVLKKLTEQRMQRGRDFLLHTASPEGLKEAVIF